MTTAPFLLLPFELCFCSNSSLPLCLLKFSTSRQPAGHRALLGQLLRNLPPGCSSHGYASTTSQNQKEKPLLAQRVYPRFQCSYTIQQPQASHSSWLLWAMLLSPPAPSTPTRDQCHMENEVRGQAMRQALCCCSVRGVGRVIGWAAQRKIQRKS